MFQERGESMSGLTLLFLIGAIGVVVFLILMFFVRWLIRLAFVIAVMCILFYLGFVWKTEDLSESGLLSFFHPETQEKIESVYGNFADKRDQHAVVDVEEVAGIIDHVIQSAKIKTNEQIGKIDKEKLIEELKQQLDGVDKNVVMQAILQRQEELKRINLSSEELQKEIIQEN